LTGPAALRPGALLALGDVALRCEVMATSTPAAPEMAAGPATPLPASATTAAPTIAWGTPAMHHLMAPNVEERDRPHLGPPRLFPNQPEQAR
jgi:hypothetical protein